MNISTLNGAALNGSGRESAITHYVAAAMSAGVLILSASGSIYANGISVFSANSSFVESGYVKKFASASLSGDSSVTNTNTATLKIIPSQPLSGSADLGNMPSLNSAIVSIMTGTAHVGPFQGDASFLSGNASIDTSNLGVGHSIQAFASCNAEMVTTTAVIRLLSGIGPLSGSAHVDAVPTLFDSSYGFDLHDGHSRIGGSAALALPSNPLRKELEALQIASSDLLATIDTVFYAFVGMSCGASVLDASEINRYYSASIVFPGSTLVASIYLKLEAESNLSAECVTYEQSYKIAGEILDLTGRADIDLSAGVVHGAVIHMDVSANVDSSGVGAYKDLYVPMVGAATTIASMVSNPRARAIAKRTYYVKEESRELTLDGETREIYLKAS